MTTNVRFLTVNEILDISICINVYIHKLLFKIFFFKIFYLVKVILCNRDYKWRY